jgi:hypothetical protein
MRAAAGAAASAIAAPRGPDTPAIAAHTRTRWTAGPTQELPSRERKRLSTRWLEPATNGFAKRHSRRPLSDASIILYDNTIREKKAPCPYPLSPADSRSLSMNKR